MKYYNKETRNNLGEFYRYQDWGVEDIRGNLSDNPNFTSVKPPQECLDGEAECDWNEQTSEWVVVPVSQIKTMSRKLETLRPYYVSRSLMNRYQAMTAEQKAYVSLQKIYSSQSTPITVTTPLLVFTALSFATPPEGFPNPPDKETFQVFINGLIVEREAITSIADNGNGVEITFNIGELGFDISTNDEFTIIGKLN